MIRANAIIILLALGPANAQDTPALYDVIDVSTDDVLNVRAGPSTDDEIIGSLSSLSQNIEVIAFNDDRTWAQLNVGETSGWASLRFLNRQADKADGDFPLITSCFGTEPFWDIRFDAGRMSFGDPLNSRTFYDTVWQSYGAARPDRFAFGADNMTATLRVEQCNDGMSDREFGLSIDVLLTHDQGRVLHSGCCTIAP